MKISNRDIPTTIGALRALDGVQTLVKDADGKAQFVTKPYDLSGKTRYAIARSIKGLTSLAEALSDANNALIKSLADPAEPNKVSKANESRYTDELNVLMKAEVDVSAAVFTFPIADLKIETNQIPGSVIAPLLALTTGEL